MRRTRGSIVVGGAVAGLVVMGAPGQAAPLEPGGPQRSTFTIPGPEVPGPVAFGPCQQNGYITELTVERAEMSFTDPAGTVVRAVAFVSFTGTLTGINGREIPYSGHFKVTEDYARNVSITTGRNGRAVLPDGEVVLAAGRQVVDIGTGEIEMVAGANTFGEFVDEICDALAT